MKGLTNYLHNEPLFLKYFLPCLIIFPLLADIVTGLFDVLIGVPLPISSLVRAVILFLGLVVLFSSKSNLAKYILLLCFLYFLLSIYWMLFLDNPWAAQNLNNFIRIFFPLLCFLLFIEFINKSDNELLLRALSLYGLIAAGSIILFFLLGVGRESYGDYAFGAKGVFVSGNDIGIAIILSSLIAWYRISYQLRLIDVLSVFVSFIGLIFIASRTGILVGGFIVVGGVLSFLIFNKSKGFVQRFYKVAILVLVLVIVIVISFLVMENIDKVGFHLARLIELFEGVSPREHLKNSVDEVLASFSIKDQLFGVGQSFYLLIAEEHLTKWTLLPGKPFYKNAELDFIDLYGQTGIVFSALYMLWIAVAFLALLRALFVKQDRFTLVALFAFCFLFTHALIAGHILFGTQVPVLAAAIICLGVSYNHKKGC